jgi:serine/threonine protein kinase/formylglycine-generating enzyme required for sulfatase activity/dienelactone hydrolase
VQKLAPSAKDIFDQAVELSSPTARQAYLDEACAEAPEVRRRVEALLKAYDEAGSFLEEPAADTGATADSQPPALDGQEKSSASSTPTEEVGTRVGPYKLLQKLGEGGMGAVWVAEQEQPVKRRVALKVIKPGMDSAQVSRRFEAERQVLALMDHTHIAKVFDAGTTAAGRPYFVMELVKGVPITKYCDQLHLPIRERLELFIPVCQAIQHAHHKGIIHRDIKPSNVLVCIQDGKPVPKVIDFGVAKALHQRLTDQSLYTEIGAMVGTLEYMSPEQAELSALDIDTRADVYALGVLLYELLTGSTPLDSKRLRSAAYTEVLRIIREEEPPRPSTRLTQSKESLTSLAAQRRTEPARLTKEVRGELDWIVMKCLEKDRSRRYETANGLARDLERHLADEPVEACPPSVGYRLRKFVRRQRTAVFLAACLAGLAATLAVGGWLYGAAAREAERERRQADHARRVREAHEKIPLIQAAIRKEQHQQAFDLLNEIKPLLPDHPSIPELWEQCAQTCSIATVPAGADVWRRRYDQPDASWQHVLQTAAGPTAVRMPRGEYLWRATKAGYREVTGLRPLQQTHFTLDPEATIPKEMVRIDQGRPNRPGLASAIAFKPVELPAFLIDRYEVTNLQYDQFVKAGGYDQPAYWQELPFVDAEGRATTWEKVKPLLVDQTGHRGPATWRQGTFPPGEEDHPVRGVSWYEAMAYARFAGKSLPTIYHWPQARQGPLSGALVGDVFSTRFNFGSQVQSVRSLVDHGFYGTFGMAGNVKEWCFNDTVDGKRFILGGGCGEPSYMVNTLDSSPPLQRGEFFGFRCVKFWADQKGPPAAWEKVGRIPWPSPPQREDLLDAATFRLVVTDRFSYNRKAPLDVTSEQIDEGEWMHIIAQINAAYRDAKGRWERLTVHLYLPKGIDTSTGYQTIVYFPPAEGLRRMRPLVEEHGLDALVRSGRALLRPVYSDMYERRYEAPAADLRVSEERRINLGQDLMRAIDYLQQRGDINMNQLGYYGFSSGADSGGSLLAVEPRLRAAVLDAGGLWITPLRTERLFLEWRHCLPQIKVPVLMLNGQVDPIRPVKESQEPMFHLLGSSIKEHYVHPGGHHKLPLDVKFERMLRWFDQHLGPPARTRSSLTS